MSPGEDGQKEMEGDEVSPAIVIFRYVLSAHFASQQLREYSDGTTAGNSCASSTSTKQASSTRTTEGLTSGSKCSFRVDVKDARKG